MLNTETIAKIAAILRVDAADMTAKLSSKEEETLDLPELKAFTDTELETRLTNEKKASYNEGKEAGVEIYAKNKKKELGYEYEGKGLDKLLEHHETNLKGKYSKNGTERVTELETDLKKQAKAYQDQLDAAGQKSSGLEAQLNGMRVNNSLLANMPDNTTMAKEDIITLFSASHQVVVEDGRTIIKKGGETLKDSTTQDPLKLNDVFNNYLTEKKFIKQQPGRGSGNEFGAGKVGSLEEFNKQMEDKGVHPNSTEYTKAYTEYRKEAAE